MNLDAFKAALTEHIVKVTFTKVDGSLRTMRATNCDKYFQRAFVSENKKQRKKNENVTYLYDIDKDSWRSMRNDSLIEWEIEQ